MARRKSHPARGRPPMAAFQAKAESSILNSRRSRKGRKARNRACFRHLGRRTHRIQTPARRLTADGTLSGNGGTCCRRPGCRRSPYWRSPAATTTAISSPNRWSGKPTMASRPDVRLRPAEGGNRRSSRNRRRRPRPGARHQWMPDVEGSASRERQSSGYRVKNVGFSGFSAPTPRAGGTIEPIDRKELRSWSVEPGRRGQRQGRRSRRFELPRKGRFARRARGSSRRSAIPTTSARSA